MKTIEEQIGGRCKHFTGMINEVCKCGINYKQAFGDRPVMKMPCIKDRMSHLTDEIIPCDKIEFPTPEEIKHKVNEGNKHMVSVMSALFAVKKHINQTGEKRGTINCPNGDHQLSYTQAESNSHVWMRCKTCDISMME